MGGCEFTEHGLLLDDGGLGIHYRVGQPEDPSTLILPRPRTCHPWQMRISQEPGRGLEAEEFMYCACGDS
jgi:hypothetical protein